MYLPKSKYKTRAAKPGEFVTKDGQEYVGSVVEIFTGACYPGISPETMGEKLTPVGDKGQIEPGLYNIKRVPSEDEYKVGQMVRYFMQDRKTQKIIEISPEAWQKNYKANDLFRIWANAVWYLTGGKGAVQSLNGTIIQTLDGVMPGIISSKVLYDPLQFYKA